MKIANSFPDAKPDLLVVEVSALLHDVLDKKYVSPSLTHMHSSELDPFTFFLPFFENVAKYVDLVQSGRAALIVKIIENVSWSTEKKLREAGQITDWHMNCIELHCVQDADRLDAIGAFGRCTIEKKHRSKFNFVWEYVGIMRCSAFSCAKNLPLFTPLSDERYQESAIAHFHDKLFKIKEHLKTDAGKKLGEERQKLVCMSWTPYNFDLIHMPYIQMQKFVEALDKEYDML